MENLRKLRENYEALKAALPWLDCYVTDWQPSWTDVPLTSPVEYRKLRTDSGNPRLVVQTEHTFDEIEKMAADAPEINFIIASGDKKLLYHFEIASQLIAKYPNLYLCTANLCNELALERLVAMGVKDKLLFGTMMPYLDPGQALGPLALGRLDWQTKCDIAGNNFRRLLGENPVYPSEVPLVKVSPFIVDAHTHSIEDPSLEKFPPYFGQAKWEYWQRRMDDMAVTHSFITPAEKLLTKDEILISGMCRESGGKCRYFEVFDPRDVDGSLRDLEQSLPDPMCIGIKIHPSVHQTPGSDERYVNAFEMAAKYHKPIMTHSWGVSDYNPAQQFATPAQFDTHLNSYPEVTFVFGHTGGRPNGLPEAVEMCRKHPQCMNDLAGDLFNNGFLQHAISEIGADKLIFATDIYWIDLRCMLAMLFEQHLSDGELYRILRLNALKTYLPDEKTV